MPVRGGSRTELTKEFSISKSSCGNPGKQLVGESAMGWGGGREGRGQDTHSELSADTAHSELGRGTSTDKGRVQTNT